MKIVRTEKQFTKENMPIDFIKEAMVIACSESYVRKYDESEFKVEISYHGRQAGSTASPWSEEHAERGYVKCVSSVSLKLDNGFDSYARIFDQFATLQGYFKSNNKMVCQINSIRWINLLLEHGFVKLAD